MDSSQNSDYKPEYDDEISLIEFILSIKNAFNHLIRHWLQFSFCIGLAIASILLWSSRQDVTYTAPLTLMLNDDGGSQVSGLSGVLGQFGIPLSSGKYNIDKLLEISRSRTIIENVLFQNIDFSGSHDFLANHIISKYELDVKWSKKNAEYEQFRFTSGKTEEFGPFENYALKNIYSLIVGRDGNEGLLNLDYGREHYIMTYAMTSLSDTLSLEFINRHYSTVKDFYIQKAVEKQQLTYNLISDKRDSIYSNLIQTEQNISSLRDQGLGSFSNRYNNKISDLNTQSLILKTALGKAEENLAIAQLALENKTPLIQIIDPPIYPISPNRPSLLRNIAFGIIFGTALAGSFLFISFLRRI